MPFQTVGLMDHQCGELQSLKGEAGEEVANRGLAGERGLAEVAWDGNPQESKQLCRHERSAKEKRCTHPDHRAHTDRPFRGKVGHLQKVNVTGVRTAGRKPRPAQGGSGQP